jgi:hypothetical protein
MANQRFRALWLLVLLLSATTVLTACGDSSTLYVSDLLARAKDLSGKDVTVQGAYLERDGRSVLALGVSTLDNGLDAQALGDPIWVEGFPSNVGADLHRPGDSVYGFVKVTGRFESGGKFGPDGSYVNRLQISKAEPIERVRRNEVRVENKPLGDGKVALLDLVNNAGQYNGKQITTQGYYFWNSVIFVLAEGISTEEDGSNPQPIGKIIWMEGFPPDASSKLNLGPNNSFVWGLVEVTGQFQSGGKFGKDAAYTEFLQLDPNNPASARPLQKK